ncbi:ISL3 family transposase [Streptococcus pluranimalium]|uniref:ISL3 family transposase n=1 Tax=Streptococcus pluranimalium TaxID=82348 RepID=UPI004046A33F
MEQIYHTTDLIGLKDKNIKICFVLKHQTHIEIRAKLDVLPVACQNCDGSQIKYDFQRASTIPLLDIQGFPTVMKLKKRRFQCKSCRKITVAKTPLVAKNCQIPRQILAKIAQLHTERLTNSAIARRLHISVSAVQRQLEGFKFKSDYTRLPKVLSWDEFAHRKGKLAFIAQDFETKNIIAILDNTRQASIRDHFLKYPLKVRNQVKFVTVDMSQSYIPLIPTLFPKAEIVIDRFHIVQHLNRAMMMTRIALMKEFDKKSLPYRSLKNHWKLFQKDSRKLSNKPFYSRTFRQTLTPKEIIDKTLAFSDELRQYYDLYQLLLFHFQEKNGDHFFDLIEDNLKQVNSTFQRVFKTFIYYRKYISNALRHPYSNAKLEATNKLIKDIKRQAFGFRNFENFKTKIFLALNIKRERTTMILSRI